MKFALIHYDVDRIVNEPGNKTVMKHFGHMPNIQLLYVAAILERLGAELMYVDVVGMNIDGEILKDRLKSFNPDIICMSVYTSHFHAALSNARFFKSFLPNTKIMLGGVHALIYPIETLKYNLTVDYVCVGEAEAVLPEFVRRLRSNESLEGLLGLVWRKDGDIAYSGRAPVVQDLDAVPFPARHLVPNEKYFNFISSRKNYTIFNTSRGCPFRCLFCEAGGQKWRARSAGNVVDEFETCYANFGIREVDIFDSSFTIDKQRVLDICADIIHRRLHHTMIWNVRSRVDTIDGEMLEALREAGCYRIFYGIESGNAEVLKNLRKMTDLTKIRKVIELTARYGISTFGYFLLGAPGDTHDSMRQTVAFAKSLPLDFAIFNALTPFPETGLYKEYYLPLVKNDFWADYIRTLKPPRDFVGRPWIDMPDAEISELAHRFMLEFYFRPRQIWRALKSVRSCDMLKRYCLAGWDMLLSYICQGKTQP